MAKASKKSQILEVPQKFEIKGYNVQVESPEKVQYQKKFKLKWNLAKIEKSSPKNRIYYKIYGISPKDSLHRKYLLRKAVIPNKRTFDIRYMGILSNLMPVFSTIKFILQLHNEQGEILSHSTQKIPVDLEKNTKNVKFHSISTHNQTLLPDNPFLFWIHYSLAPIPKPVKLIADITIFRKKSIICERECAFQLMNDTAKKIVNQIKVVKIQIPDEIGENDDNGDLTIIFKILRPKEDKALFKTKKTLKSIPHAHGIKLDDIKYRKNVAFNEISNFMAKLKNSTPYKFKGKATFSFLIAGAYKKRIFTRKFFMDSQNYEILSEDVKLPTFIGGHSYSIQSCIQMKSKIGSVVLTNTTSTRKSTLKNSQFFIEFRPVQPSLTPKMAEKYPIFINYRLGDESYHPKKVKCQIILNYENIAEKILKTFIFKHHNEYKKFVWKVYPEYGAWNISVKIIADGIPIHPKNIECKPLRYEIKPKL